MQLIYDLAPHMPKMYRKYAEIVITGSWQYGTANEESDVDLVYIHDKNIESEVLNVVGDPEISNTQKTGTFKTNNGIEKEYDIRFLSYTEFVRKLYSGDINCVEYICSPYNCSFGKGFLGELRTILFTKSLPNPYYKYKILHSLMGFMNPINRKKSKKFIIPEKVNQNNLIKIANLYYLLKHNMYPLNPSLGISSMRDYKGNMVELIDAESPHYNSTEIMITALERYDKELKETYTKRLEEKNLDGAELYKTVLEKVYEQPTR